MHAKTSDWELTGSVAEAQASIPILRKVEYFITRALWL